MVKAESGEYIRYFPEKVNRAQGTALHGKAPDQNHLGNWIDCIRTRKTPNAPAELGYRSAIAVHMANLAYKLKQRVTLEAAKSMPVES
jgi:hypothetical protein